MALAPADLFAYHHCSKSVLGFAAVAANGKLVQIQHGPATVIAEDAPRTPLSLMGRTGNNADPQRDGKAGAFDEA